MTTTQQLQHGEFELAQQLIDAAIKESGIGRPALRDALAAGLGKALYELPASAWPVGTEHDRAVACAGRLLLKTARELGIPVGNYVLGPTAGTVLHELLTR